MKRIAVALAFLTAACWAPAEARTKAAAMAVAGIRTSVSDPDSAVAKAPTMPLANPAGVGARCTEASGYWSAEGVVDLSSVTARENTEAAVWECRVGGRRLVVRHAADLRGYYGCSATVIGKVSAWVDGVKVIRSEPIGDFYQCIPHADEDITSIVAEILLRADGTLVVCRLEGRALDERKVCEPTPYGGRRDPAYYPPEYRTKPALLLRIHGSPICQALTSSLSFVPGGALKDPSLDAFVMSGTANWGLFDRPGAEESQASLDIDNDGRVDSVWLVGSMRMHGMEWGAISWRPGGEATAGPFRAGELPDNDEVSWNRFSAYSVQPVTVAGRNYVYVRRRFVEGGPTQDLDAAADRPSLLTRGLLELHPDGKVSTVCGWGPKVRPEERL